MDHRKAFDTVSHKKLLQKFYHLEFVDQHLIYFKVTSHLEINI